ncbi:type VII secretion integral membrane protein EccD [Mycolicibacterium arenosum]|uniref:Type VII secretion integral membrane protein EccD n=1 Tax=Mycolicibacterium arenosum TaxID=2952157 RepID=A0ABT1ME96_9MYCO|nr:type VII secretion integral membrane protein EccD [Mycolicibacterium sp. CAU 1645]MCP9276915.1 type VII secretion integral membrane protein EccD [Mycolicibacterium sp. CAU 1645]
MTAVSDRRAGLGGEERTPGVRAAARVRLREQVRVAVLFDDRQTDMALPATEPVATLVGDVLRDLLDGGEALRTPDGRDLVTPGAVALKRVTGRPLSRGQSLAEQGVKDGDLLILEVDDAEVSFTPVIENASSAIAQHNATKFASVTPQTATAFAAVAAAIGAALAVGLLIDGWRLDLAADAAWPFPALVPAITAAALALILLTGGALTAWRRQSPAVANALRAGGVLAATAAAFICAPNPPASWHLFFAAVTAAVLAILLWRFGSVPRGAAAWLTLVGIGAAALAALRGAGVQTAYLWVGTLAVSLVVLKSTETLAQVMARVPMPPFPTITGRNTFDDADEIAAEALVAAETEGTPSVAELERAADDANTYLRAIVAAVAPFLVLGAYGAVTPFTGRWVLATVFVLGIATILVFRGRDFTDRVAAVTVVATALAMAVALGLRYVWVSHDPVMSLGMAMGAMALGFAALVVAAVVPARVFSAPFRKGVEWVSYGLQVLVVPATLWLLNLYFLVRNAL